MNRLSGDPCALKDRYSVVVIGSGYGGSIAAARLAASGHAVCLLERGREWVTGSFPDEADDVARELRSRGNPLGLYDYRAGDDIDVLVGNGLGGTSLINANVVIRPGGDIFAHRRWPEAIQRAQERGELEPFVETVRRMLRVTDSGPPGGWPAKVKAMRRSASKVGGTFAPLEVAVNLREYDDAPNHVGVVQQLCTQCGDCVTGCNVGAKNTLTMNYLPLARREGAEIFSGMEVQHLLPASDGGYVLFIRHRGEEDSRDLTVHGQVVVVAAGSLGSTGILLRSAARGLPISRRVGHHFSGNADQLGFGYNNDVRTDVLGFGGHEDRRSRLAVGPTILSSIDFRDRERLEHRFIIEEGAVPRALVDVLRRLGPKLSLLQGKDTDRGLRDKASELSRILRDQIRYDPEGAANHSMVYLGMGHDGADGRVVLDHEERVKVLFGPLPEGEVLKEIDDEMYRLVEALGGTHVPNPRWSRVLGRNAITVHPLGGCPMGEDPDSGVVDHLGRVFLPGGGFHPGLYVADGSVLPTSVGVNPLLTISVLAERIADHLVNRGDVPERAAGPVATPEVPTPPVGLEFTETMRGFLAVGIRDASTPEEYEAAEEEGKSRGSSFDFTLTVILDDLAGFMESKEREAIAEGWIDSEEFGRRRVDEGRFNLFIEDEENRTKRMLYCLKFLSAEGEPRRLDGYKEIRDDPGLDAWADNTTLFTTVRRGFMPSGPILGQGIIRVRTLDFLKQLTTFRVRNSPGAAASARWLARFGRFFFGEVWETFIRHQVPGTPDD